LEINKYLNGLIKGTFGDNKKFIMSNIAIRLEDLVPIGVLTIDACETDMADFTALSSSFSPAFIIAARTKMGLVDGIVNPEMLIRERMKILQRIDRNLALLMDPINKLEFYVNNATGLTIGADKFGIGEVRVARNSGNLEKLDNALRNLLANTAVAANLAALIAKGYSVVKNDVIVGLRESFSSDKAAQGAKDKVIAKLRTDNAPTLGGFWDLLTNIWQAGKSIYKVNNPSNAQFYTIDYLKSKMHHDTLHGAVSGFVKVAGHVKKGLVVALKPVLGGRLRKCTTGASGNYEIAGLAGNEYGYTVYEDGLVLKAGTFKLVTAQKLEMDISCEL